MSALSKTAALLGGTPKLLKLATPAIGNVHSRFVRGGLGFNSGPGIFLTIRIHII